ncbi:MAG: hypothetical protein RLO06_15325 [Parvibaculum sp.]
MTEVFPRPVLHPVAMIPACRPETANRLPGPPTQVVELDGPVVGNTTYASFRVTLFVLREGAPKPRRTRPGSYLPDIYCRFEHGAGAELYRLDSLILQSTIDALLELPRPVLFGVFHTIWFAQREAEAAGYRRGADRYSQAFVSGRLRKRKNESTGGYRVWIEEGREGDAGPTVH